MKITHCPTINRPEDRQKINKRRKKVKQGDDQLGKLAGWNCNLCPIHKDCKFLCPPMQWIVAQVEVEPSKETIPANPVYESQSAQWPESNSTTEIIFSLFFFDHKPPKEIADLLSISVSYVYKTITKSKELIMKNLQKKVESASYIKRAK